MISLHISKWLEQEGFGTLDTDIFWEDVPLDSNGEPKEGVWVVTRGSAENRNVNLQQFDIYSRYANKLTGSRKLENILQRIKAAYGDTCELPTVPPYSLTEYYNVVFNPISGIESVGVDEQEKVVRVISGTIQYQIRNEES